MTWWQMVDAFIAAVASTPGTAWRVYQFANWLDANYPGCSPWASEMLQHHRIAQGHGLTTYKARCPKKGRDAYWVTCDPSEAVPSFETKVEQLTAEIARDFWARPVKIAKGDATEEAVIDIRVRAGIAQLNALRALVGVPAIDIDAVLTGSAVPV